ncbi:MAG TPA: hypothetical protein VGN83_20960 [Falsiroseomonas sp.]|jgi:hypothetical protein|nr:hypothetical protein [Falsiroseomonas sp.]
MSDSLTDTRADPAAPPRLVNENAERLASCPRPHDFVPRTNIPGKSTKQSWWQCTLCGGVLRARTYGWYLRGRYDGVRGFARDFEPVPSGPDGAHYRWECRRSGVTIRAQQHTAYQRGIEDGRRLVVSR